MGAAFEYEGHDEPDAVLVTFGSVESLLATQVAASLMKSGERIGVIAVRVYRPFSESHFLKALPTDLRYALELRHASWNTDLTAAMLREHHCCCDCVIHYCSLVNEFVTLSVI